MRKKIYVTYGYSTKRFNEQVKNNIEKFDEDFRFQVTKEEYREILRSKKSTLEQGKYSKFLPYAFTEQGIYMLISVLKGDLAVRQSKFIIRLFKKMKDYIVTENRQLLGYTDVVQIVSQVSPTRAEFNNLASDVRKVMENFDDPTTYKHFLILNGQKLEADIAYTQIYSMAKKSIIIVDDYVGIKTLDLLRGIAKHVSVKIYSDEKGPEQLTEQMLNDFRAVRQDVTISVDRTRNKFHDRYVFLDYGCYRRFLLKFSPILQFFSLFLIKFFTKEFSQCLSTTKTPTSNALLSCSGIPWAGVIAMGPM